MPRVARATAVLGASVIAVAASCFSKPGEPHAHLGDDGGPHDGIADTPGSGSNMIDGSLANCGVHDDFNTLDPPCALWGTPSNPNYMQRTSGVLQMTPQIMGGSASCTTTQAFKFTNGTSIEIPMPLLTSMGDHSWFKITPANSTADYTQLNIFQTGGSGAQVQVTCSGPNASISEGYSALTHRYWRFTPQNGGDDVKIESGQSPAMASTFAGLGDCNWLPTSVAMVTVSFGVNAGAAANNTGTFDNFNTNPCPPP